MDKIKREDFEKWIKGCNWFKISEPPNPKGYQANYLTPAGEFVIVQYDLQSELQQVIKPMAAPVQPKVVGHLPPGILGGSQFPQG